MSIQPSSLRDALWGTRTHTEVHDPAGALLV